MSISIKDFMSRLQSAGVFHSMPPDALKQNIKSLVDAFAHLSDKNIPSGTSEKTQLQDTAVVKHVAVSNDEFDQLWSCVMAMPARKRKNFKSTLCNKWGTKTKVKFVDGKLRNYDLVTSNFVDVVCPRDILASESQATLEYSTTFVALAASFATKFDDERICKVAFEMYQEAMHTGNHNRNQRVTVPPRAYGRSF
jgi:hypothetical protein